MTPWGCSEIFESNIAPNSIIRSFIEGDVLFGVFVNNERIFNPDTEVIEKNKMNAVNKLNNDIVMMAGMGVVVVFGTLSVRTVKFVGGGVVVGVGKRCKTFGLIDFDGSIIVHDSTLIPLCSVMYRNQNPVFVQKLN